MLEYLQVTSQKQTIKINPLQIQFLNLLQMGELELGEYLANETVENPFLQETNSSFTSYNLSTSNNVPQQNKWLDNQSQESSFQDHLMDQLNYLQLEKSEIEIASFILASLDEKGLLRATNEEIAEDFGFNCNKFIEEIEVEKVLLKLSGLEPLGVGSRSIPEYLAKQLVSEPIAKSIVFHHIDELENKNYELICHNLKISIEQLKTQLDLIYKLKPFPAYGFATIDNIESNKIFPEYRIELEGEELVGSLVKKTTGLYKVDKSYLTKFSNTKELKAHKFLESKLFSANWILEALQQREETMSKVLKEIIIQQKSFFRSGGDFQELKPMILRDISERVDLTISTVSRVTSSKYVDTPFGIICLKDLFSESIITSNGILVSNKEVQNKVETLILNENKIEPLTDMQIRNELSKKGINLNRRTIAKYRENLKISSSKLRRTLGQ